MNKKYYFLIGVLFMTVTVIGISLFNGAIEVDTSLSDYGWVVSITEDPTGYGITLEMLHNRYSEFLHMEVAENEWLFHFNQTELGWVQHQEFAGILRSVVMINDRFFATDTEVYRCAPEYISQLDRVGILCDEVF